MNRRTTALHLTGPAYRFFETPGSLSSLMARKECACFSRSLRTLLNPPWSNGLSRDRERFVACQRDTPVGKKPRLGCYQFRESFQVSRDIAHLIGRGSISLLGRNLPNPGRGSFYLGWQLLAQGRPGTTTVTPARVGVESVNVRARRSVPEGGQALYRLCSRRGLRWGRVPRQQAT